MTQDRQTNDRQTETGDLLCLSLGVKCRENMKQTVLRIDYEYYNSFLAYAREVRRTHNKNLYLIYAPILVS